jgi:PAS domain S-box-containing protein
MDPELHRRATERLRELQGNATAAPHMTSESARLVSELQIHQIELKMQNEELQQARVQAEALIAEYTELYEFSPTGYFTLDREGTILRANLNGARLLGINRSRVVNQRFIQFVADYDQRDFNDFLDHLFADRPEPFCELALLRGEFPPFVVEMKGFRPAGGRDCRVAITDITERRRSEDLLSAAQVETARLLALSDQSRRVLLNAAEDQRIAAKVLEHLSARQDAILAAVPEILIEVDTHQILTWANQSALEFFGDDVLGKDAAYYFEGEQAILPLVQVLHDERPTVSYFENWQRRKDGKKRLLAWRCRVLKDATGEITGALSSAWDITEHKQAEKSLRDSLHEKESMLKEIHHRVNNNLQIISSLLRLQAGQVQSPAAQAAMQDMQNRVRSMALIHEHLYRSDNLAEVDLAAYIRRLCQQLFHALAVTPAAIQLVLDLAPVKLSIDQAIPCGLLVNELVSNALKHAFPAGRAGLVRVELHPLPGDDPGWRLLVADNGVGLPAGFSLDHLTSLGMKLCADLTRQLGAVLEIGAGPGAQFVVQYQKSGNPA